MIQNIQQKYWQGLERDYFARTWLFCFSLNIGSGIQSLVGSKIDVQITSILGLLVHDQFWRSTNLDVQPWPNLDIYMTFNIWTLGWINFFLTSCGCLWQVQGVYMVNKCIFLNYKYQHCCYTYEYGLFINKHNLLYVSLLIYSVHVGFFCVLF